jgi:hypothetical protein
MKHIQTFESFVNDEIFEGQTFKDLSKAELDEFKNLFWERIAKANIIKSCNFNTETKSFNILFYSGVGHGTLMAVYSEIRDNFEAIKTFVKKKFPDAKQIKETGEHKTWEL